MKTYGLTVALIDSLCNVEARWERERDSHRRHETTRVRAELSCSLLNNNMSHPVYGTVAIPPLHYITT